MRKVWLWVSAACVVCAMGANCIPVIPENPDNTPRQALLRSFESETDMRTFLAAQAKARNQNTGGGGWFGWFLPMMGGSGDFASAPNAEGAADDRSFSTTNIQETGVDESDLIKNNGDHIFMLSGDNVHVLAATPPDAMVEVAVIRVAPGASTMYLRGNTLVVLSQRYSYWYGGGWAEVMPAQGSAGVTAQSVTADLAVMPAVDETQTTVTILDVADPANPVLKKAVQFEADLANSRMIGAKLHLVMTAQPRLPDVLTNAAIDAMSLDEWIPDVHVVDGDGSVSSGDVVGWDGALRPEEPNGYGLTIVATLDVDDLEAELSTTAVTANVGTIYASTQSLYLTDTQYTWTTRSSRTDTMIHKLEFTDTGTRYMASGLVPGRPLNQYSLGEHEDYLRIATTNEQFSTNRNDVSSGVYVLGDNNGALETVGKVENIAPGETIYSARFVGDRGFLVTFRRVDPLFTMDLSEPTDPRIVGELKVPGYSDHIQMLGDHHLLTIGRNAEEVGDFAWVQGVLLTIFDVSDMANPQILKIGDTEARVEIGGRGTYSEANSNPKAFNYFASKNVLAFPIDLYDGQTRGAEVGNHAFTGLYVYRVTVENGFEFLGRIASAEGPTGNGCFRGYYGVTRGVFIDDFVYSVTAHGAKVASLADVPSVLREVTFTGAPTPQLECFWAVPEMRLPPSADLR